DDSESFEEQAAGQVGRIANPSVDRPDCQSVLLARSHESETMMQRVSAALLLATAFLFILRGTEPRVARGEDRSFSPGCASLGDRNLVSQGVLSCASTACHHRTETKGTGRNEYTTWVAQDPHARAYLVLFEEPARQIVKNLYGLNAKPAVENLLCLNCHV